MTTCCYTVRLARQAAPLAVMLLLAACNQQSDPPQPVADIETAASPPHELQVCDDKELTPLQAKSAVTTLPVAYPAGELGQPLRIARPFPLSEPQIPLPRRAQPRSVVRDVRPLPDEPVTGTAEPVSSAPPPTAVVPDRPPADQLEPPVVVVEEEPTQSNVETAPARLPAVFASQASPGDITARARPMTTRTIATTRHQVALQRPVRQAGPMQAVNRQAEQMIRHGYYLAERGALYSARAEFIQALRTVAQALDLQFGGREHTQALAAGLTALEEAEDFVPEGSRLEADLDVAMLIHAHRTPACKAMDAASLLPVTVLQHYYTYGQEQLAVAAGGEEAASMALFGLGKTYSTLAIEKSLSAAVAEPKAMVFHWAALSAHSGNFLAANELAVLEARWGQYSTARALLQYSLAILPHSAVWRNLATVHQRLGEAKLADLAMREAQVAAKREAAATPGNPQGIVPSSDVQWLDSKTFASTSRSEIDVQKPTTVEEKAPGVKATPVVAPAPPRQRSAASWFPWFR